MKTLAILFLFVCGTLRAQDCQGTFNKVSIFQGNKIGAAFQPQGNKFFDGYQGMFFAPYTSLRSPSTIFAGAPWIAGYINGELRMAAQTYAYHASHDYYSGPLSPQGEIFPEICANFDRVWEVSRDDIINHIEDYNDNQQINSPLSSVFGWPAQGNTFFDDYNGFALPEPHNGGWAAFEDLNQNSIYEPDLGEYPNIYLKNKKYIPEQMMWMVFNDQGVHTASLGEPLGMEIQLTVYGFLCTENTALNNSVFNSYKIINQSASSIDSLFLGSWTDYDLGCAGDDYFGSDSTRNTEFVYNQDQLDGVVGIECESDIPTYGAHPPVQSMTYLSHPMNSVISTHRDFDDTPLNLFHLLNGLWPDGTPITAFESGYNPGENYPVTKFSFHGDPTDPNQWAQINFTDTPKDIHAISSVYLEKLDAGQAVSVDLVYQFHQDESLDFLQKVNVMYDNVDFILNNLDSITIGCSFYPSCLDEKECVWPGDFDHNGIADHFDILYWGVMNDSTGNQRDGLINWRGHYADQWQLELPNGINAKHGDGDGDGIINENDIERNIVHFLYTNPYYQKTDFYPEGPEVVISSTPIGSTGEIRSVFINAGTDIENVLGIAYELEYDTSIFKLRLPFIIKDCPTDSNSICMANSTYAPSGSIDISGPRYAFVKNDHQPITIEDGFQFQRLFRGLVLKEGATIPDSTILRLRNLIALDAEGNDLHIGANTLVIYNEEITGTYDIIDDNVAVYPNPAEDVLYIEAPSAVSGDLTNIHGQSIRKFSASSLNTIDIADLPSGIYYLKIVPSGRVFKVMIH